MGGETKAEGGDLAAAAAAAAAAEKRGERATTIPFWKRVLDV